MQDQLEQALERISAAKRNIDAVQEKLPSENGQLAMCEMNLRAEIERLESILSLLDMRKLKPVA